MGLPSVVDVLRTWADELDGLATHIERGEFIFDRPDLDELSAPHHLRLIALGVRNMADYLAGEDSGAAGVERRGWLDPVAHEHPYRGPERREPRP